MSLESSEYLEQALWPQYPESGASRSLVLSVCAMVNEKARERVPIWQCFIQAPDRFPNLVHDVLQLVTTDFPDNDSIALLTKSDSSTQQRLMELVVALVFLSHCFTSLAEVGVLRTALREVYSLGMWRNLPANRLEFEFARQPQFQKLMRKLEKWEERKLSADERERLHFQHAFVWNLGTKLVHLFRFLSQNSQGYPRVLLWFIDLLSMLMTRRFVRTLVDSLHLVPQCKRFVDFLPDEVPEKGLTMELVRILDLYAHFQIDDLTGDALDEKQMDRRHCERINQLQLKCFSLFKKDQKSVEFATNNIAAIEGSKSLVHWLSSFSLSQLRRLAVEFSLLPCVDADEEENEAEEPTSKKARKEDLFNSIVPYVNDKDILLRIFQHNFAKRSSHMEDLNAMSLYPNEELLWDEGCVPVEFYSGEECLALPKLGLQFLTLHDYLLKNFNLYRLETAFDIRGDMEDAVRRLKPWAGEQGQAVFDGWSRMALPLQSFNVVEVAKPALGSRQPARVRADLRVTLINLRHEVRQEWEQLRRHDPVFLLTIRPTRARNAKHDDSEHFCTQYGVVYVRGCEIEGQVDQEGKLIPDEERFGLMAGKTVDRTQYARNSPTWRVRLDPCQYQDDLERMQESQNRVQKSKELVARARREGRSAEHIEGLQKKVLEAEESARAVEDVYDTFNVVIRRKPKENNFKAVLETIRDLMNTRSVVPDWLLDLLMGYLDPAEAHYSRLVDRYMPTQNWFDTFLDEKHLANSFPQYKLCLTSEREEPTDVAPPYRLTFPDLREDTSAKVEAMVVKKEEEVKVADDCKLNLEAVALKRPVTIPPVCEKAIGVPNRTRGNKVPFTSRQVEAIRSGMQCGLTLVVGPPGTGKTDVAVQIIHNLYHNYPNQRILIVTHSNQALNQLFEKIVALNVDERHLLRLGHGEGGLNIDKDFSRYGRVDYILAKRLELLREVMRLSKTLCSDRHAGAAAVRPVDTAEEAKNQLDRKSLTKRANDDLQMYTCETAQYFFVQTVLCLWEEFIAKMDAYLSMLETDSSVAYDPEQIRSHFPFMKYFAGCEEASQALKEELFPGKSFMDDMTVARTCFRHVHSIFTKLDEFRAFELMRTGVERANYLLVQEAKIIAMTCTHAALRRRDLVQLGFTYDSIIMEEAAQILEIETFIPLLLQNPDISGQNRLKRWIMIGDHNQLPPVVKNQAFNNYSNMGQSLFARLVKLGVPTVQLDAQGRARPSLSRNYSWRYEKLADLPHVRELPQYRACNPGFVFDSQLINVDDYQGVGESEPSSFFYQNLAEAEYIVATYMYMRVLGYPAERISILTTYNGQKHLIRDVLKARCADNPLLGLPSKVTTVDRFQGQQNDYVLISLVRTKTVGYLRDIRRLVVALSRARLGMYIFARVSQFSNCQELRPAFDLLLGRDDPVKWPKGKPTKLHLVPSERFVDPYEKGSKLRQLDDRPSESPIIVADMSEMATRVKDLYDARLTELMSRLPENVRKAMDTSTPT